MRGLRWTAVVVVGLAIALWVLFPLDALLFPPRLAMNSESGLTGPLDWVAGLILSPIAGLVLLWLVAFALRADARRRRR